MFFNRTRHFVIIASAMIITSSAQAGVLVSIPGSAMVNSGDGFKKIPIGTQLNPGDRVIVSRKSMARITFEGGCEINLTPSQLLTITRTSPCSTGPRALSQVDFDGRMGQQASLASPVVPALNPLLVGLGVAVIAGGVGIVASNNNDDDPAPASPLSLAQHNLIIMVLCL